MREDENIYKDERYRIITIIAKKKTTKCNKSTEEGGNNVW